MGDYQPIKDWRLVFGQRVPKERIEQIMRLEFRGIEDLSTDEMYAVTSKFASGIIFHFIEMVRDLFGEDAAMKIAFEWGYRQGKRGYSNALRHFNTKSLTPEQMAWYQDAVHLVYGAEGACICEYDEEKCTTWRNKCLNRGPAGMEKYANQIHEGYYKAYTELDPNLTIEVPKCMVKTGDDHCIHHFIYKKK